MSYQEFSTQQSKPSEDIERQKAIRREQLATNIMQQANTPVLHYEEAEFRLLAIRREVALEQLNLTPALKGALSSLLNVVQNARTQLVFDAVTTANAPVVDYEEGERRIANLNRLLSLRVLTRREETHLPDPPALIAAMKKLDVNVQAARRAAWTRAAIGMTLGKRVNEADDALISARYYTSLADASDKLVLIAENKPQCEQGLLPTEKITCVGGCGPNHKVITSGTKAICISPYNYPGPAPIPKETLGYNAALAAAPHKQEAAEHRRRAAEKRTYANIMNTDFKLKSLR